MAHSSQRTNRKSCSSRSASPVRRNLTSCGKWPPKTSTTFGSSSWSSPPLPGALARLVPGEHAATGLEVVPAAVDGDALPLALLATAVEVVLALFEQPGHDALLRRMTAAARSTGRPSTRHLIGYWWSASASSGRDAPNGTPTGRLRSFEQYQQGQSAIPPGAGR